MVASTSYTYDTDPDILAFKPTNKPSDLIPTVAPKKSTMYGKNPNLQYNDYENDPDIEAFTPGKHNVNAINTTNVSTPEEHSKLLTYLKDRKKSQDFFANQLGGVVEPALSVISGTIAKPVGQAFGVLNNLISPQYGTQEGIKRGEKIAEDIQEQFTYKPRTEAGQQNLESLSKGLETLTGGSPLPEVQVAAPTVSPAVSQLKDQFRKVKDAIPKVRIETVPSGLQSAGAAATTNPAIIKGNIDSALAKFDPNSPVIEHISKQAPENVNINSLETRALEEKHGVDLLKSQRTNNLSDYVQAWNHREDNGLSSDFAQQPKQLAQAFEESKQRHAPRIHADADASELGQHEINGLVEKDKLRLQNIKNKYLNLKDSYNEIKKNLGLEESNDLPLDGKSFVENSKKTLNSEMFTEDSRKSIDELLNKIENKNGVMTFQEFTTLDKRLSELSKFGKGSEKEAARLTREHLNNMELTEDAAPLYPLLKDAKATAKERFDVIDSNPAYAKAIGEGKDLEGGTSQGESLNAAKFHRQYVSTATPEAIRRLKAELPEDHIAHEAITYGELDRAKKVLTNANESRVKSDQFGDFLRNNKPILKEALSPEAMQDVTEIGFLNSKIGKPDAGTFSHSNTYSAMLGDFAANGLLTLGEKALSAKTGGLSAYPVSMAKKFKEKFDKNSFANEQRNKLGGLTKEQE